MPLGMRKSKLKADSKKEWNQEFRNLGISQVDVKKGVGSAMQGNPASCNMSGIVDERCVKIIEEFENYHGKEGQGYK